MLQLTNPGHKYFDDEWPLIKYIPTTDLKKRYSEEKNRKVMAYMARKNPKNECYGMTLNKIFETWDRIRDEGLAFGTMVHKIVENYIHGTPPADKFEERVMRSFEDVIKYLPDGEMWSEHVVGLDICDENRVPTTDKSKVRFGIGGMIDIPYFLLDTDAFLILDIKTDKEIPASAYGGKKMLHPIQHLPDTMLEQYFLQVETYAKMLEHDTGLQYHGGYILHWLRDGRQFDVIEAKSRRLELDQIIKHYFKLKVA